MGQAILVEEMKKDGADLIEKLLDEGVEITSACWLKESDGDRWHLYLVTPLVKEGGAKRLAYRRVNEVQRKIPPQPGIDYSTIKVVSPDSPVATTVAKMHELYPGRTSYVGEGLFGKTYVDAGFIYAPLRAEAKTG